MGTKRFFFLFHELCIGGVGKECVRRVGRTKEAPLLPGSASSSPHLSTSAVVNISLIVYHFTADGCLVEGIKD